MSITTDPIAKRIYPEPIRQNVAVIGGAAKTWQVTNHTDAPVVVLDAYLSDPSSTDELYQRSLHLLPAGDGIQSIKAGETKTISLGVAHTGSNGTVDYSIIIARADNLFPVKVFDLPVSGNESSFPDTTVTADDAKLMKGAENFVQAITAFPSSEIATAFAAVLPTNDEKQINSFFQTYAQYGAIILDQVVAIQTYYHRYGFVWAGYNKTQSYSLYTTNGTTTKKNLGTITINNGAVAPVTNLDAPAGFTATYMDVNHRKTALYYTNGQFSEDVVSTSPKICLQGLFILKSQLTGLESDNLIVPTLYGTVNGNKIFGFTDSGTVAVSAAGGTSNKSGIAALLDPQDISGWLKLSAAVAGIILGLIVASVGIYFLIKRTKKGSAPTRTPEEIERLSRQKVTKIAERMVDANIKVPDNLDAAISDIKTEANATLLENARGKMKSILRQQEKIVKTLLDKGRTPNLENAFTKIESDIETIPYMDLPTLEANVPILKQHISQNAKILNDRYEAVSGDLNAREAKLVSDCKADVDRYSEFLETSEDIREDLLDDKLPEIIEE